MTADRRVRIYPTGTHYIPGVPAVEQLVEPDEAERLLAWSGPAFTKTKPADWPEEAAAPTDGYLAVLHRGEVVTPATPSDGPESGENT